MSGTNNLDAQNPWPGLQAYTEEDSRFFYGRDAEIDELLWLVRRNVLTVVFGASGTGKTSLVHAGLFPKLREEDCKPHRIRLNHGASLVEQVKSELNLTSETLWEGFHRLPDSPRLVVTFDQFEEIFTLGAGRPASDEFLIQLADLVENYYPASIRGQLARGKTLDFEHDRQPYHIILALREDFVGLLDRLRARMPAVMRARFAVQPFTEEKALEAVEKPGQAVVDSEVARQIVRFTASKRGPGVVDPAILCLLCRELNRGRPPGSKISAGQLEGDSETILSKFWEDSIAALDDPHRQPVREFIEDRLVSPNGFRTAAPRDEVASHATALDALVDGRLLRGEERFGTPHLELTHDVLCPVVRKTREERRLRTEQAEIERQRQAEKAALERQYEISRLETERRAKTAELELVQAQARRNRTAMVLLLALAVVAVGAAVWAFRAQREGDALRSKEKELRTKAEDSAAKAESNSKIARKNEEAAKTSEANAKLSAEDADRQREIAAQQTHLAQAALIRSSVQDASDLVETNHAPQAMAHLARSLRIPGDSVGARSWFTDLTLRNDWWSLLGQFRHQEHRLFGSVQPGRAACGDSLEGQDGAGVGGRYRQACRRAPATPGRCPLGSVQPGRAACGDGLR